MWCYKCSDIHLLLFSKKYKPKAKHKIVNQSLVCGHVQGHGECKRFQYKDNAVKIDKLDKKNPSFDQYGKI